MVFKNEHETNGETWYSYAISVSSKKQDGTWISASMPIRFRKGTTLYNRTRIEITEGWPIVIEMKDRKVVGLFANEFEILDGAAPEKQTEFSELQKDDIPF